MLSAGSGVVALVDAFGQHAGQFEGELTGFILSEVVCVGRGIFRSVTRLAET